MTIKHILAKVVMKAQYLLTTDSYQCATIPRLQINTVYLVLTDLHTKLTDTVLEHFKSVTALNIHIFSTNVHFCI